MIGRLLKSLDPESWLAAAASHRTIYLPMFREYIPDDLTVFDFPVPELVTGQRYITTVPTTAAYTLLALLDLQPDAAWADAQGPLCGSAPVIDFIATAYGVRYAPNTRETIRDDAVKFFVEEGLLLRNPDDPNRPTNSGKTVYQIEQTALALLRKFGTPDWKPALQQYLVSRESLKHEIARKRYLARVPITLPDGSQVAQMMLLGEV